MKKSTATESEYNEYIHEGQVVTTSLIYITSLIPALSEVLCNNEIEDEMVLIFNLKRKTAPPISVFRDQRAEELVWVKLFPEARNCLREN